jgi:colanic acid/amylovoran biosynthesis protein
VRRRVRAVLNSLSEFLFSSGIEYHLERLLFRRALSSSGEGATVLIAPPAEGNIGDQALVESFLENVGGRVVVIERNRRSLDETTFRDDVVVVSLPELVYGKGTLGHLRDVAKLARHLGTSGSLSVVGADMLDGAYSLRGSVRRSNLVAIASEAGLDARILGFSWNGRSHPRALHALRRAGTAGAELYLRDPVSLARAEADGVTNAVGSADTVFAARTVSTTAVDSLLAGESSPVALVNASGLILKKNADQTAAYVEIIDHLRGRGFAVVLLPHVLRASSSDLQACQQILSAGGWSDVRLVGEALSPAAIRGLCRRSEIVVTGRMHLAVMALSSSVPPVTLSTQGKVEGLMQLMGVPDLCIEPDGQFASAVIGRIDEIVSTRGRGREAR